MNPPHKSRMIEKPKAVEPIETAFEFVHAVKTDSKGKKYLEVKLSSVVRTCTVSTYTLDDDQASQLAFLDIPKTADAAVID